ncbi:MAG: DPP IV N-terminal domain-containing protein [Bacteroidales bacterium]|nr:DPP IV N-terminal domain-containing protein [Candidatus Cacconaster merdequi]
MKRPSILVLAVLISFQSFAYEGKELVSGWVNPTYSPDSSKIAYTLDNDLYTIDVFTHSVTRHTFDGSDVILNGYASWVYYEEIFGRPSKYRAFWWSPDSKILAYYRFDDSQVPMFPIYYADGQHGHIRETHYPKTGDRNPEVKIGFVSVKGGETVWADFDPKKDQYFGIPFWSADGTRFMVAWMDRAQDNLELYSVEPLTGRKSSVYSEHQNCWIDWMEEMLFTPKGIYFVRDFTGWQQIYYQNYDGSKFEQLTSGRNWGVKLLRADDRYVYYTARCESPLRNDIYRVSLRKSLHRVERISYGEYDFSSVRINDSCTEITADVSNAVTPVKRISIRISPSAWEVEKFKVTVLENKAEPADSLLARRELLMVPMRDGVMVPASVIWPAGMDTTKKYPVIVDIYGGPDNPQVKDVWRGYRFKEQWWANHGVIQVTLDNRAGGILGKMGIEAVYRKLGVVELQDFIDGIKYFRALPYVDGDKVGVQGFSFGGTMTTLCVTEGNEYFKYGIAGGGVYDWSLYDTHYAERYMDRPQDNPEGYAASRVIDRIGRYKGDRTNMLRLTHGTGDDNVHFQNTLQLVTELENQRKDFELMVYPGGMHGYRGSQGIHSDYQDFKFWYRYLLESEMPEELVKHFEQ